MNTAPKNNFGWTHWDGISDMSDQPTLKEQVRSKGVSFTETTLNMGGIASEPAYVISYLSPTSKKNVSILVVPTAGIDSWSEEYYYFVGLDPRTIPTMNWYALLQDMRAKVHEDVLKSVRKHK